jgi:hypothetical protein
MTESRRRTLFLVLFAVVFFQTGAHVSQAFVNYPAWQFIDRASFPAYHRVMTEGALRFLLIPRFVELALAVVVLVVPPLPVRRWQLGMAIALAFGGLVSTLLIQRPIHVLLETMGNTPELLSRLRSTDRIRHVLELLRAALYLWMGWLVVRPRRDDPAPSGAER